MAARKEDPTDYHASEQPLLAALRHPLRRRILKVMGDSDGPISPRQVSDKLRQPLSNVSYHVRVLAEHEAILMVDVAPVRGSMQHFYEVTIDEPWALAVLGMGDNNADNGSQERGESSGGQ